MRSFSAAATRDAEEEPPHADPAGASQHRIAATDGVNVSSNGAANQPCDVAELLATVSVSHPAALPLLSISPNDGSDIWSEIVRTRREEEETAVAEFISRATSSHSCCERFNYIITSYSLGDELALLLREI